MINAKTIKNKLSLIFFLFIGLILLLIVCLVAGLLLQRVYFTNYVNIRDRISSLSNIMQLASSQKLHFDYYILLNEDNEKENFLSLIPKVKKLLEGYSITTNNEELKQRYENLINIADKVFKEKNRYKKVEMASDDFLNTYNDLINKFNEGINFYIKKDREIQKFILFLNMSSWIVSIIVIILALFIIFKYGAKLYSSIMTSLKVITDFANILSKGEYREINYSTDDEFQSVISTFNQMVKSLKTLQTQVLQMDRLSNIGQLAGGVAHELNNPLVGVLGQAQILLEKLPPDSPFREHVVKIERAALRCKETVSRLLQFSRQKEYEYTVVDINEVIDNVIFLADSELKANNIQVVKLYGMSLPKVKISIPHIQQAILNIVNNAIQAMEYKKEEKILQIKTYLTEFEENKTIIKYIAAEFIDNGCGISKENLALIFEPFFTTKSKKKFAGVGLSITKDIVLHHKGKISVYSEGVGNGAKFIIYLPCLE